MCPPLGGWGKSGEGMGEWGQTRAPCFSCWDSLSSNSFASDSFLSDSIHSHLLYEWFPNQWLLFEWRATNREMEKYLCGHFVQATRNISSRLQEMAVWPKQKYLSRISSPPSSSSETTTKLLWIYRMASSKSLPRLCSFCRKNLSSFQPRHNSFLQQRENLIRIFHSLPNGQPRNNLSIRAK